MLSQFILFFCLSGLICVGRMFYIYNWGNNKTKEEIQEKTNNLQKFVDFDITLLIYVIGMCFGWLILPFWIILKLIKLLTGKDILE